MHISSLVDDVHKVLEDLRAKRGDFVLAMLYNSSTLTSSFNWNLIVAAPWTDQMEKVDAIRLLAHALHDGLSAENQTAISRVTVLNVDDPFVRDMTFLYPVTNGGQGVPISQITAGDVAEGSGFVFYSRKLAAV